MLQQKEFHTKLNRVRQMMQQEGLDGCVLKRPENFAWMTGGGKNYLIPGVELGLCSLVVCEDALYAITNNIEAPRLKEEEQLEAFGFQLLAGIWHDDAFPENTLNKLFSGKAVGFDYPHPLGRNVAGIVQKLRYSLTEEEVAKYIEGGRLVTAAVEEVAATVRRGDTELQTLGRLASLTHSLGLEPLMLFCAADERFYKFRHPIPTQKPILERAQFGGNIRYKGLTICLNRYVNLVPVSKELERQYRANVEIDCLLIRHSVPGNTYTQALLAGKQAYEERGYGEEFHLHHLGGPIGYVARDIRVGFTHNDVIPENQAFCWNPSITGTISEDTIISTQEGPVFVTKPMLYPTIQVTVEGEQFQRVGILEKY